ncbi:MAG: ROK family protein [Anaerolineales bacterium]
MNTQYLAVDIGGTNMRVARFDQEGAVPADLTKVPTLADEGPDAVIQRMVETIKSILDPENPDIRIGVGAPGPIDPRQGLIYEAPNLPGWIDVPLRDRLQDHFDCPIAIGNDANVAALGEWRHGAGRGSDNIIYLTISTGIGGGVVTDGQLLIGAKGVGAELGHLLVEPDGPRCGCGKYGHLEAVASGTAIARTARQRLAAGASSSLSDIEGELTAAEVGEAAISGDDLATKIILEAAEYIGRAMADYCHIFNPAIYVLGGGVSQLGDFLFDPIRESLERHVMHPIYVEDLMIAAAELGDDAGLVGAMALAEAL